MTLAWLSLALLACLEGRMPPDTDMTGTLFTALLWLAMLGLTARGLALSLAMIVPGALGIFLFGMSDQWQMVWAPLYLGTLLAIYNLGSGRRLTFPIALSQLLLVTALVPTLVAHFSWLALPAGLAGASLAGLAAIPQARSGKCERL